MNIVEVSKLLDCPTETLRYYERIGIIPKIHKNQAGEREYTYEEVEWIRLIQRMKKCCLPTEAMIEYVTYLPVNNQNIEACKAVLLEQVQEAKKKQAELQSICTCLHLKIDEAENLVKKQKDK